MDSGSLLLHFLNIAYELTTLALTTLGLAVVFGLLGVLNMAHGEFVMLGAYSVVAVQQWGWPLVAALPLALAICAALGWVVERWLIRPLYARPFDTLLATWALAMLMRKSVEAIWGKGYRNVESALTQPVSLWGTQYPAYRLGLIVLAVVLIAMLALWYRRSSAGLRVRAMTGNPMLAQALGIDTRRLASQTFVVGVMMAGAAGVMLAPLVRIEPGIGVDYLLDAFFVLVVGGLGTLGGFSGDDFLAYQVALFLIYGIATQGVALCWGRLGFLPLGHALFFGLGAYLTGGALKAAGTQPLWLAGLLPAILLPAGFGWLVARLIFARSLRSGPYFSLITLAMTMLGFLAAQQWSSVTGGFNGLGDIPEPLGIDRFSTLYWLVAAAAVVSTTLLSTLIRRPLGVLWSALAQNEERLQLFGYATDRIKANAYALSAGMAALAGALFAAHQGIVTPQTMSFVLSTEFVIWAAVGGKASPLGALLGAVIVGYTSAELRDHFAAWEVFIALLFIVVVRFLPDGLSGLVRGHRWPGAPSAASAAPAATAATAAASSACMPPIASIPAPPTRAPTQVPTLAFEGVHCTQGGVRILSGLDLKLEGPGIRAVIGPNGAGKTSAFNAMTGRLPVNRGRILVAGRDVTGQPAWRVARLGVGRKLQVPSVFAELTVAQNLAVALWAGRLHGLDAFRHAPHHWRSKLGEEMLDCFPELAAQQYMPAGMLAQGHRQALELVLTVLPEPHLLLLDEPCAGLSPAETHRMISAIQQAVRRLGAAALLIEHDLAAVAALRGEVFVLHQGRLLAQGPLHALQQDPAVRAVYAGASK